MIFTSDNGGFAGATKHAPLRANRGSHYEGGIRVPLIVAGAGVKGEGRVSSVPAITNDLYPTILEMVGLPLRPHQHLDAVSLAPVLRGSGTMEREELFWHYPHYNKHPHSAPVSIVRKGSWKLIEFLESGRLELYDLKKDVGERNDLAQAQPELTKELLGRLEAWKENVRADPMLLNPRYRGK